MNSYYSAVKHGNLSDARKRKQKVTPTPLLSSSSGGSAGAIFLAVCRGKVSEGLDFADDNARAVVSLFRYLPIPFEMQIVICP